MKIAGRVGPMPRPERWLFVVGCYNSGTTLLHDMLAAHPDVGSMRTEGQFRTNQLPTPNDVGLPRLWALRPELFRLVEGGAGPDPDVLKRQWGAAFRGRGRRVLIEHSPPNAARTRWLQAEFPAAHFVGIIRDGFAVSEGIRRKAGHSLELAARQWARSNEIMLEDFQHLERSTVVRYEDLVRDPDAVVADVLSFVGLDTARLDLAGRVFRVHERESPIRDMNESSIAALTDADRSEIREHAGDMLRRLGYA